jgi:hypothetical protein
MAVIGMRRSAGTDDRRPRHVRLGQVDFATDRLPLLRRVADFELDLAETPVYSPRAVGWAGCEIEGVCPPPDRLQYVLSVDLSPSGRLQ